MTDFQCASWPGLKRGLIAILRGVKPDEIGAIADVLVEAGISAIKIPLNSPDPFTSIEIMAKRHGDTTLMGAGTVLARAAHHNMVTMPGVFTPTEAFAALDAGASALKFFPASIMGAKGYRRDQSGFAKRLCCWCGRRPIWKGVPMFLALAHRSTGPAWRYLKSRSARKKSLRHGMHA